MSSQTSQDESDKENTTPKTASRVRASLRKKVLFSPGPKLFLPSLNAEPDDRARPVRPALKVCSSPLSSPISERNDPTSKAPNRMIASAIATLSGSDRAAIMETYTTLTTLVRNQSTLPDQDVLASRVNELFGHVVRHAQAIDPDHPSRPDHPLETKAIKLAGFLMYDNVLSSSLSPKLARELLEHSLLRMSLPTVTRSTAGMFLWLWQTQRLPRNVIGAFADRILKAATDFHHPSSVIAGEKLSVFFKILQQEPTAAAAACHDWLPGVFRCMLDDNRGIRTTALRLALEAGRHFSRNFGVGRCVVQHLRPTENGGGDFTHYAQMRFNTLRSTGAESGGFLAQVWGAICTLAASQGDRHRVLTAWTQVLQTLASSSEGENQAAAQRAWVRMVHAYASNGDAIYRNETLSRLVEPVISAISRPDKVQEQVRVVAADVSVALLYASVRPSMTDAQVELVWSQAGASLLKALCDAAQPVEIHARALDILIALLEPRACDPWVADRLIDHAELCPRDIIPLDVKWIKRHTRQVGELVQLALATTTAPRHQKLQLWSSLLRTLRLVSAKEVHVTPETLSALATIIDITCDLELAYTNKAFEAFGASLLHAKLDSSKLVPYLQQCVSGARSDEESSNQLPTLLDRALGQKTTARSIELFHSLAKSLGTDKSAHNVQAWRCMALAASKHLMEDRDARDVALQHLLRVGLSTYTGVMLDEWVALLALHSDSLEPIVDMLLESGCPELTYLAGVIARAAPSESVVKLLSRGLTQTDAAPVDTASLFLEAGARAIEDVTGNIATAYLKGLQSDVCRLAAIDAAPVAKLYSATMTLLLAQTAANSVALAEQADYFIAGFRSEVTAIRDTAIIAWNDSFGKQVHLEYPAELLAAIDRVRDSLVLPPASASQPQAASQLLRPPASLPHVPSQTRARSPAPSQSPSKSDPRTLSQPQSLKRKRINTNGEVPMVVIRTPSPAHKRRRSLRKSKSTLDEDRHSATDREAEDISASQPDSAPASHVSSRVRPVKKVQRAIATQAPGPKPELELEPEPEPEPGWNPTVEPAVEPPPIAEQTEVVLEDEDAAMRQLTQELDDNPMQESLDEQIFIDQLREYRAALTTRLRAPLTPRRRARLGTMMREIAGIQQQVTDVFFGAPEPDH